MITHAGELVDVDILNLVVMRADLLSGIEQPNSPPPPDDAPTVAHSASGQFSQANGSQHRDSPIHSHPHSFGSGSAVLMGKSVVDVIPPQALVSPLHDGNVADVGVPPPTALLSDEDEEHVTIPIGITIPSPSEIGTKRESPTMGSSSLHIGVSGTHAQRASPLSIQVAHASEHKADSWSSGVATASHQQGAQPVRFQYRCA